MKNHRPQKRLPLGAAILAATLTGCRDASENSTESLQEQVKTLRIEVDSLKTQLESTKELITAEVKEEIGDTKAIFGPTSLGYRRAVTPVGVFLLSLENVSAYAGGSRIILSVGNPMTAEFANTEFWISYKLKEVAKAWPPAKDKLVNYKHVQRLRAGFWSRVSIDLPEATPDQLGEMTVSVHPGVVYLTNPPK